MDEPRSTQPQLYKEIDEHPTVTKIYADKLTEDGLINEEDYDGIKDKVQENLQEIYNGMTEDSLVGLSEVIMPDVLAKSIDDYQTAVSVEILYNFNKAMLVVPVNFNI